MTLDVNFGVEYELELEADADLVFSFSASRQDPEQKASPSVCVSQYKQYMYVHPRSTDILQS
jgi:hypothetical protein